MAPVRRSLLACTALTLALGFQAHSTFAQDAQPEAAASGTELEEIVVTARKREERLQSVPAAISAFSQADLERKNIESVQDLARAVPSLATNYASSDPDTIFGGSLKIRGLPGVIAYFAQVPLTGIDAAGTTAANGFGPGMLYDLESAQVLKGPQGTLFGQNALGGAILYEPKRPSNAFGGYVQFTLGNYNDHELSTAINVPVVEDKVLVRAAFSGQQRDGYTHVVETGVDLDDRNYGSWRIGVTVRPTDDFENYLLYDGYYQRTNGSSLILRGFNQNLVLAEIPLGPLGTFPATLGGNGPSLAGLSTNPVATALAAAAAGRFSFYPSSLLNALAAEQAALGPRNQIGRTPPAVARDYFWGLTNITKWDVSDSLSIKNTAALRITKSTSYFDFDGSGLGILNAGFNTPSNDTTYGARAAQYTDELQVTGKALGDKLDWLAGGFLQYVHPLGYDNSYGASFGTLADATQDYNSARSQALYVHGVYDLSSIADGLKLSAGYRYTWDFRSDVDRAVTASGACLNHVNVDANCVTAENGHFQSPGWNVSLDYQLEPATLVYVRAGNSYLSGGFNPLSPVDAFRKYQPQHVTDEEVGIKSDWDIIGVHARTDLDAFHSYFKSILVTQTVQISQSTFSSLNLNAASADVEGLEFEGTVIPLKGLEISPHLSAVHSKYDQYPVEFGGGKPPFLGFPAIQWGLNGTYHIPIGSDYGDLSISATYSWYGHQIENAVPTPFSVVPSNERFDASIDWTNVWGQPIDASFFVTNLTDNSPVLATSVLYNAVGVDGSTYAEPRMFGFRVKYRFGADAH